MKRLITGLSLLLISACASLLWTGPPKPKYACLTTEPGTLVLSGPVDDAMLACAETHLDVSIKTVIVNSWGGEVKAGRAIGRLIGAYPRTLIVERECLSSCGNYFVPAAQTLVMRPGAFIGLHGTLDPMFHAKLASEHEATWAKAAAAGKMTVSEIEQARQDLSQKRAASLKDADAFAAAFNTPKGWRMYRLAGAQNHDFLEHFDGEMALLQSKRPRMMLVDYPMLASCLPDLRAENYQETLETTVLANPERLKQLAALGVWRSNTLTCKPVRAPAPPR